MVDGWRSGGLNRFLSLVGAVVVDDLSAPTGRVCVCAEPPRCVVRTGWDAHVARAVGERTAPRPHPSLMAVTGPAHTDVPPAVKNDPPLRMSQFTAPCRQLAECEAKRTPARALGKLCSHRGINETHVLAICGSLLCSVEDINRAPPPPHGV